jgi:hypothetical protein
MASLLPNTGLTFNNEGHSNPKSRYYSRVAHWPGSDSGVTIGRGYDMKKRDSSSIMNDLVNAGVEKKAAEILSKGSGLINDDAKEFVKKEEVKSIEIDEDQEIELFNKAYKEKENDFNRICKKSDTEKKYGKCDLAKIDPAIKEFAIDLLYRGDYNTETRTKIQTAIIKNDYDTLITYAKDPKNWGNVDGPRKDSRISHLEKSKQIANLNKGKSSNAITTSK